MTSRRSFLAPRSHDVGSWWPPTDSPLSALIAPSLPDFGGLVFLFGFSADSLILTGPSRASLCLPASAHTCFRPCWPKPSSVASVLGGLRPHRPLLSQLLKLAISSLSLSLFLPLSQGHSPVRREQRSQVILLSSSRLHPVRAGLRSCRLPRWPLCSPASSLPASSWSAPACRPLPRAFRGSSQPPHQLLSLSYSAANLRRERWTMQGT